MDLVKLSLSWITLLWREVLLYYVLTMLVRCTDSSVTIELGKQVLQIIERVLHVLRTSDLDFGFGLIFLLSLLSKLSVLLNEIVEELHAVVAIIAASSFIAHTSAVIKVSFFSRRRVLARRIVWPKHADSYSVN